MSSIPPPTPAPNLVKAVQRKRDYKKYAQVHRSDRKDLQAELQGESCSGNEDRKSGRHSQCKAQNHSSRTCWTLTKAAGRKELEEEIRMCDLTL